MIDFDHVARQLAQQIQDGEAALQRQQVQLIGLRAQLDLVTQLREAQQTMLAELPTPAELDE